MSGICKLELVGADLVGFFCAGSLFLAGLLSRDEFAYITMWHNSFGSSPSRHSSQSAALPMADVCYIAGTNLQSAAPKWRKLDL